MNLYFYNRKLETSRKICSGVLIKTKKSFDI